MPKRPSTSRATALKRIERKLQRDRAAILSDAEVLTLAEEVRSQFAVSFPDAVEPTAKLTEDLVRWRPLGERCRQARLERGWTFRTASVATGVPQYRIKALEHGLLTLVRPDLARRYFRALKIVPWIERWARANGDLAERVGLR